MGKQILKSGLIAGGILTGLFLISYFIYIKNMSAESWNTGEILGYSSMIIALTAIYFGIKSYRDKVLGGKITFGKAFILGTGISGIAAVIFGIYIYLLFTVISPDLSTKMIDVYREKIKTSGQTQEVIADELKKFETESEMWNNPFQQSFIMIITVFMIGLLISMVSAAILKRKEAVT